MGACPWAAACMAGDDGMLVMDNFGKLLSTGVVLAGKKTVESTKLQVGECPRPWHIGCADHLKRRGRRTPLPLSD